MKTFLKHIWQFPQHLVAWILILVCRKERYLGEYKGRKVYYHPLMPKINDEGVCLGNYIFHDNPTWDEPIIAHEYGHSRQSLWWGWLYFIVIGIPSGLNIRSGANYYRRWPENQANKLGGVEVITFGKRPCDFYLKLKK